MVGARWAPVSDDFQKILDGSLEEGLKRSAWEGSAPAIEKFKMEVLFRFCSPACRYANNIN
jgi:hypothetical protein